jgi:hypothetical protein
MTSVRVGSIMSMGYSSALDIKGHIFLKGFEENKEINKCFPFL